MMDKSNLHQARIAVNIIAIILTHRDDTDILAYISNATASLRDLLGCEFIDWELISDTCDQREYALSSGSDNARINKSLFNPIISKIQARCGTDTTQMVDELD